MEIIDEILGSMFITYMHAYCQAFKLKSLFLSYKKKKKSLFLDRFELKSYSVISNLSKLG